MTALRTAMDEAMLGGAVKDAGRMLSVLDAHIAFLKKKRAGSAEWRQPPSNAQQFFYVLGADGVVRLQPDSTFVVEQISIGVAGAIPYNLYFSLEDTGASRGLSQGVRPGGNNYASSAEFFVPTNSVFVPSSALVPELPGWNDYWFVLPAEWQLPRAALVRMYFGGANGGNSGELPGYGIQVVLSGYKIFG